MKLLLLLGVAFVTAGAAPQPPLMTPPFVRTWTRVVGDGAAVTAVRDGAVFYQSRDGVGSVDVATGRLRWRGLAGQAVVNSVLQGRSLHLLVRGENAARLVKLDIHTRRERTLARLPERTSYLNADARHVYVLDDGAVLRAYDLSSGALRWTRALSAGKPVEIVSAQLAVVGEALYVGSDAGEAGVSAKDGKLLWKRAAQYAGLYPALPVGGEVITQHGKLRRLRVKTGKVVWEQGEGFGDATLIGDVLVGTEPKRAGGASSDLVGRRALDGRVQWRLPVRDAGMSYGGGSALADSQVAWFLREPVVCVSRTGREVWHSAGPFTGTPLHAERGRLLTADSHRLLGYSRGTLPALPSAPEARRQLAEQICAQFELLDDAERNRLRQLSPFAFRPLLRRYTAWARAEATEVGSQSRQERFGLLTEAAPLLHTTFDRADTETVAAALKDLPARGPWRGNLEQILQAKGDPAGFVPEFVRNLRALPAAERGDSSALEAVTHSSHPDAIVFMLEALRDPQAPEAWRQAAFRRVAGTGSAGVAAVREHRPTRAPRKPWHDRIDLDRLHADNRSRVKQDARGRAWMLFQSAVLGNNSDLFIAEKQGAGWSRPLFTGAWTDRTLSNPAPKSFRGIPIEKLLATEWVRLFPDDAEIRKDADADGLTDLVETRLAWIRTKRTRTETGWATPLIPAPTRRRAPGTMPTRSSPRVSTRATSWRTGAPRRSWRRATGSRLSSMATRTSSSGSCGVDACPWTPCTAEGCSPSASTLPGWTRTRRRR